MNMSLNMKVDQRFHICRFILENYTTDCFIINFGQSILVTYSYFNTCVF